MAPVAALHGSAPQSRHASAISARVPARCASSSQSCGANAGSCSRSVAARPKSGRYWGRESPRLATASIPMNTYGFQ